MAIPIGWRARARFRLAGEHRRERAQDGERERETQTVTDGCRFSFAPDRRIRIPWPPGFGSVST
jgi:hypothetical protein